MRIFTSIFTALPLFLFLGCGSDGSLPTFDGKAYRIVTAGTLAASESSVSGSGSLVFNSALAQDDNSFRPTFTLDNGGSLSLVTNSDNLLENGNVLKFTRNGTTLTVTVKIRANTEVDISSQFTGVDASQAVTLQIDVHNDETPTHFTIWNSATTDYTTTGIYDSEDTGPAVSGAENGAGSLWGLILANATVTAVTLSERKAPEE